MTIINPNARITLGAPLPSDPTKMASYNLPADPAVQGVQRFTAEELGLVIWVITAAMMGAYQRIARLERIVAAIAAPLDLPIGGSEAFALRAELVAEVQAQREAERKLAEEQAKAGGVQ